MVSVIIPVKNRKNTIERAINSVFSQKGNLDLEVIVVDDASTDNTVEKVKDLALENKKIQLIENKISYGGAKARNIGVRQAKGDYIAFLDSDDEWLENHLQEKIELINITNAQGAFGAFNIIKNNKRKTLSFPKFKNINIPTYIFEKGGDARTSTFVFQKGAFMKVMFDDGLAKHQDWDVAIRFDDKFSIVFDEGKNVNMYVDGKNRMSNNNNYNASNYFIEKHKNKLTSQGLYNFKLNICFNAFRIEGNSDNFKRAMSELKKLGEAPDVVHGIKFKILYNPISRMFLPVVIYLHRILR